MADELSDDACRRCGRDPAIGYARIEGTPGLTDGRYCHGNSRPSCYEQAQADLPEWLDRMLRG